MWKDKFGRDVNIGDFIIYGRALGRCAGISIGKVIGYKTSTPKYYTNPIEKLQIITEEGSKTYLEFPSRVIVIPDYHPDVPVLRHGAWGEPKYEPIEWKDE
jgi:hypothetical protein